MFVSANQIILIMDSSPIALFVYKRINHTKLTINSLQQNSEAKYSVLYIFSDGPKSEKDKRHVEIVRDYIKTISGFKSVEIYESGKKNLGLASSIISGVTTIVNRFGKVIVLEDDMIVSPFFLKYMNDGLNVYEHEHDVISIHGYIYPVKEKLPDTFFLKGADCWGWATWKRSWEHFEPDAKKLLHKIQSRNLQYEFDHNGTVNNVRMLKNQIKGKVDSWAIRWHASAFLSNKLTLYPGRSLVQNIGMGEMATHTKDTTKYDIELTKQEVLVQKLPLIENKYAKYEIEKFFKQSNPNFINRWIKKIKQKF